MTTVWINLELADKHSLHLHKLSNYLVAALGKYDNILHLLQTLTFGKVKKPQHIPVVANPVFYAEHIQYYLIAMLGKYDNILHLLQILISGKGTPNQKKTIPVVWNTVFILNTFSD